MSLLSQKLSGLQPGTRIRFMQTNGHIIEGVVTENDRSESLSLRVAVIATLRYDQIAGMEETLDLSVQTTQPAPIIQTAAPAAAPSVPIQPKEPAPPETAKAVSIGGISSDKESIAQAFKALASDARKKLTPAYDKFQSAMKSHEQSKLTEALDFIWNQMILHEWEYDISVNLFYARMALLAEEFQNAAISFYYAEDVCSAYRTAYQGAEAEDSTDLYKLAAVFSAICFTRKQTDVFPEAAEVLKRSSARCKDVSGIGYAIQQPLPADADVHLREVCRYLSTQCGQKLTDVSDLKKCLRDMQPYYPVTEIAAEIGEYTGKAVAIETVQVTKPDLVTKTEPVIKTEPVTKPVPDTGAEHTGRIVKYNYFESTGHIEDKDGTLYPFDTNDIADTSLRAQVKKITTKEPTPIYVKFRLIRRTGKYYANEIKRGVNPPKPAAVAPAVPAAAKNAEMIASADQMLSQGRFEEAIDKYRKHLDTPEWEHAFASIIKCYLRLWDKNGDMGYSEELDAFIDKYGSQISQTAENLEALQQYYMKTQRYSQCLEALNSLMELYGSEEYDKMLQVLYTKEKCYRILKDHASAISQLADWLDIVKRNKITESYKFRETTVYMELAELYFESGDLVKAEKYANLSAALERRAALLKKLEELKGSEEQDAKDDEEEGEDTTEAVTMTLPEAYDAYQDEAGFYDLNITDADVVKKLSQFKKEQMYCLLTWLSAASQMVSVTEDDRKSECVPEISMGQAIQATESAFSFAFNNPLSERTVNSTEVISVFETAQKLLPEQSEKLFAAAALRTLFNHSDIPDYTLDDLTVVMESGSIAETFPALIQAASELLSFREKTGFGIDAFAAYKTNTSVIEGIIAEAKEICEAIDMKNDVFESQGQVRRMREYMFSSEASELRVCLDIAAANKTEKFQYVKDTMAELFIRSNKPLEGCYADIKKLDKYIDRYWDLARDVIQSEGRHIARPHDKIKGSKRNNIVITMKRMITCICDWLAVAEHSSGNDNFYAKTQYATSALRLIGFFGELVGNCTNYMHIHGFDWGTESIRLTAEELLAKLKGTYDSRKKKYFFIDFLSGEDVLLNDEYLPELQSTFCGWQEFNILYRIEHHASRAHLSLTDRISEILSDNETKHNFRSARLLRSYAEDTGLTELAEHKDFEQYNDCLKQAKQRFDSLLSDFNDEIELYESYGTISDINGEKSGFLKMALDWYRISRITNDFGFYVRLLDIIRNKIAVNAAEQGERLMHQLEELADKPEYDFGVYPKESIAELIKDQNYTVAEYMLNCIRRHDTKTVMDYTIEPFSFFSSFMNEHTTNYRIVFSSGSTLEGAVLKYVGKKNLEFAMKQLTNNGMKDVRGGCNLINHWSNASPAGASRIEKLLTALGFTRCTVTPDEGNFEDSYLVVRQKQTGKVNYPHPIPAFSSLAEEEGFRVLCLYGRFDCNRLMDMFRTVNTAAKHTLVFLDYALNQDERRKLARKIKEEKSFAKTFVVVDRVILLYLAKHYASNTINKMLMAITMPFAYYQPFVEASNQTMPPELFTGREAELVSIESADGANLVYGGRQLGKSALLKMAQHNIDKNANGDRAVLVEIKELHYTNAAKVVSAELILAGILGEECRCDDWDVLAEHLKKRLMDNDPETRINYLLLMLDEADEFIRTSMADGNRPVSALKNLPANRFKLVMAGLHNLSRYNREEMLHGNSNLIHLNSIIVRPFQRPEAIKLLTNTLAYLGFRFKEDVISLILAKTNYFPGLIQLYCQKLLEAMKNDDYAGYSEISTPSYEVTESHIKKVLSDTKFMEKVTEKLEITLFVEETGHSHYHVIALILAYLYYTAKSEKGYTIEDIIKTAQEYNITRLLNRKREQIEELLQEMWDLNVLSAEEDHYRFATESFREMLGSQEKVEQSLGEYFGEGENK